MAGKQDRFISQQICYSSQLQKEICPREGLHQPDWTKDCDHRPQILCPSQLASPINQEVRLSKFCRIRWSESASPQLGLYMYPPSEMLHRYPHKKADRANVYGGDYQQVQQMKRDLPGANLGPSAAGLCLILGKPSTHTLQHYFWSMEAQLVVELVTLTQARKQEGTMDCKYFQKNTGSQALGCVENKQGS